MFSTQLLPGRRLGWEIEQLADEVSELFGHRVDLVSLRSLHPLLRPSVLAEARPVYADVTSCCSPRWPMPREQAGQLTAGRGRALSLRHPP